MDEDRLARLERQINAIADRNMRVEADKAWETSPTRTAFLCAITYIVAAGLLCALGSDRFWLNALLPVSGYLISSQSLPWLKRRWIDRRVQTQANQPRTIRLVKL